MSKFLSYPVDDYRVNQRFGENANSFYKELGMLAHNGIDIFAPTGVFVRAAHNGTVIMARTDSTGGKEVDIVTEDKKFKTVYYHLLGFTVNVEQKVRVGDVIGIADNTGRYTTGSHLHFGLKEVRENEFGGFDTLNKDNGYRGAIDPEPYWNGLTAKEMRVFSQVLAEFGLELRLVMKDWFK